MRARARGCRVFEEVAAAEACSTGLCLVELSEKCLLQGCTSPCDGPGDGECPPGSLCEELYDADGEVYVCKPGLPHDPEAGLSCPP